ncbi:MAG: DUF2156 domain-containing protein [Oscillospiraceae bacterium]|nr:DUF2156 domain-containing protein [Oscillospiraceae bacterium]
MIDFRRLDPARKEEYDKFLMHCGERGCEYSFSNLYMWGRQEAAFVEDSLVLFSQFDRRSVYPFPIIRGDAKRVLDTIIDDAHSRKIRCRIASLIPEDCALLERLYPGKFRFYADRDGYDYIYAIDDLADLKGRKFQKKRNHLNRFREYHPDYRVELLNRDNLPAAMEMVSKWMGSDSCADPGNEFYQECRAMRRAFCRFEELDMEGMILLDGDQVLAMTMGSRLSADTFDVHFEKALDSPDSAYPAINYEFSRYLREKYPDLRFLNREDDLGLPGLRKAKLSYNPDHFIEKSWARLVEDDDED